MESSSMLAFPRRRVDYDLVHGAYPGHWEIRRWPRAAARLPRRYGVGAARYACAPPKSPGHVESGHAVGNLRLGNDHGRELVFLPNPPSRECR